MLVSIITVTLNPGDLLVKTVQSVLCQDNGEWELIIQDGGSSDGSLDGLPDDPRIHLIQEADSGIYDAMNRAVKHASGDVYNFLNAGDTFVDSTILSAVSQAIQAHSSADIIYTDYRNVAMDFTKKQPAQINQVSLFRAAFCHQTLFFRNKLFQDLGGYDISYSIRADLEFLYRCYAGPNFTSLRIPICGIKSDRAGLSSLQSVQKKKERELASIRQKYIPKCKRRLFRLAHELTLFRLRRWFRHHRLLT